MPLFTQPEIEQILDLASAARLVSAKRRRLLLAGLPSAYVDGLESHDTPLDQLRSDLNDLNDLAALEGVEGPPIGVWLVNAASFARLRPEGAELIGMIERLNERVDGRPVDLGGLVSAAPRPWSWFAVAGAAGLVLGVGLGWALAPAAPSPQPEVTCADAGVGPGLKEQLAPVKAMAAEIQGAAQRARSAPITASGRSAADGLKTIESLARRLLQHVAELEAR